MNDCIFCKFYKSQKKILFQNEYFFARFDEFPTSPGHFLLIPNRHVVSFFEVNHKESELLHKSIKLALENMLKIEKRIFYQDLVENPVNEISKKYAQKMIVHQGLDSEPDGYNIGVNDGIAAGRSVHHLHIHVIPRFKNDVDDPRGGVRNVIPEFKFYKK